MNGDSRNPEAVMSDLTSDTPYIFVCRKPECEDNPTVSTVPFCDRCGGSYCAPICDGREGQAPRPIPAHSERGLELQRQMGLIKAEHLS